MPDILQFSEKIRTKKVDKKSFIWDVLRKKWLVLQPEELVRQCLILYMNDVCQYPLSRMQIERKLKIADHHGRYDLFILNKDLSPLLLVECKSFEHALNESHFQQIVNYNIGHNAPYIGICNGINTQIFQKLSEGGYQNLPDFPSYT